MDVLCRLQAWYLTQSDGGWQHQCGVTIETLDNPGWHVEIDLTGTDPADRPFVVIAHGIPGHDHDHDDDDDRYIARRAHGQIVISCGPLLLSRAVGIFLDWADA
ncbi:MAG: Imm53 family immunity protein [Pseudomonadota bacterium]